MKSVHFIGIGGIGMSGLAKILLEKGTIVYLLPNGDFFTTYIVCQFMRHYFSHGLFIARSRYACIVQQATLAIRDEAPMFGCT